mgnify:CR=1 FL=1
MLLWGLVRGPHRTRRGRTHYFFALVLITTIFMPLTFIAGIYGMNFEYMPELKWPWGYPMAIGIMGLVAAIMLIGFRRKKWL